MDDHGEHSPARVPEPDPGYAAERAEAVRAARTAAAQLGAERVSGVALGYVDTAGVTRVKAVPAARLVDAVRRGVGISPAFDAFLVDDSATSDGAGVGGPDGDLRLVPDLDRLVTNAPAPAWAWAPAERFRQDGSPHPACQRRFARRMAERAERRHGLVLRMGFETEWTTVLDGPEAGPAAPGPAAAADGADPVPFPSLGPAYGAARLAELPGYLAGLLDTLHGQGVTVLQIHPEYSPGQFEVSTAPESPVGAADTAVLVRETIRAATLAHHLEHAGAPRLRASFAPVVLPGTVGNGRHLHLSLWRDGVNLCRGGGGPFGMTGESEAFLAGVLAELPALLALGAPSPASYLRLVPSNWAGAFQCWGLEAREAAIRFVAGAPDDAEAANAEVKCLDGAANPYLVVGGVIAAGLAGLAEGRALPAPVSGDPARDGGIAPRLPESLGEAADRFAKSEVLRAALGEQLHTTILAVRRAEAELFAGSTPARIAAATRWRY